MSCLSTPQASSFALLPTNASWPSSKTLYWLSHHVEKNSWWTIPFQSKKTINITFTFERHWRAFLVLARIFPPTATTALLFQHRSRVPTFYHMLWHFSESLHQYSNDLIAPYWLWRGFFCSSVNRRGTNFAATRCIFSFSVKIVWHELLQMPTSSETSRRVRRRFSRITERTFSMWSSPVDEEGRPDLGSSSMDVLPDLKRCYHS